jgi:hypothetical protein
VEALGNLGGPSRLVGGARWLYFGLLTLVASEENSGSMWCSKKVIGLLFL